MANAHELQQMPTPHASYHYMYPAQLMPMTPLDYQFTPMLPLNLLSTPSPYMGHATFLPQPPQLPHRCSHARAMPMFPAYASPALPPPLFGRAHSLPVLPYLPQHTQANIEQLKLSRTVMLRYINKDVSLTELLSEIDVGPIEYCKMFSTACPAWLKPSEDVKSCSISFFNTQTSVFFVLRYAKNQANLRFLKARLKNSVHLQISLNESLGNSGNNQDLIKIKTFNYIQENDATRAVSVVLSLIDSPEAAEELGPEGRVEVAVRAKFAHFGDIEHILVSSGSSLAEYVVIIHFTSIDASIKSYEHINKQIEGDEQETSPAPDITVKSICFARDRCDCTEITSDPTQRRKSVFSISSTSSASLANTKKRTVRSRSQLEEVCEDPVDSHAAATESHGNKTNSTKPPAKSLEAVSERFEPLIPLMDSEQLDLYIPEDDLVSVSSTNSDGLLNSMHGDLNDPLTKGTSYLQLGRLAASFLSLTYESGNAHSSSSGASVPVPGPTSIPFMPAAAVMHDNAQNRTLFLGNLHPNTTVEEIANNVRAGGLVEWIRSYPAKHICFITFIDPAVALKFYLMHQVYHQLVIHGNEICVKWGKNHLGPLSRDIALAVTAGASRNVYIGHKKGPRSNDVLLPNEQELRRDFSRLGDIEQVNFFLKRNCGFVNFLNIIDAVDVVDAFKAGDEEKVTAKVGDDGSFYAKYSQFNISFGKDRCGNPLKFSFKRRDPEALTSDAPLSPKDTSPERLDLINLEAAMVFGISTETPAPEEAESPLKKEAKSNSKPGKYEKHYVGAEAEYFGASAHASPIRKVDTAPQDELELDSDDSFDAHDDISIIIGLGSPRRKPAVRQQYRHEKVFHNNFNYFDDLADTSYGGQVHLGGPAVTLMPVASPYGPYAYALYEYRQPLYAPQHSMLYLERAVPMRTYAPEFKPAFGQRTYSSGSQVMADYLAKSKAPYLYSMNGMGDDRRRASRSSKATVER